MTLHIYGKNKKILKTFTTSTYDLRFGTVEDALNIVTTEDLDLGDNVALVKSVMKLATRSMDTVKGLLLDIFDGLTETELRDAQLKEIALVLIEVVRYAVSQMAGGGKN